MHALKKKSTERGNKKREIILDYISFIILAFVLINLNCNIVIHKALSRCFYLMQYTYKSYSESAYRHKRSKHYRSDFYKISVHYISLFHKCVSVGYEPVGNFLCFFLSLADGCYICLDFRLCAGGTNDNFVAVGQRVSQNV